MVTYTETITPAKFNGAKDWNVGILSHLVAALAGAPVAIQLSSNGHTVIGAKLTGVSGGRGGYDYPHLHVEIDVHTTAHLIFTLGDVIIPLDRPAVGLSYSSNAIKSMSAEQSKALAKVQAENPGSREWWGRWSFRHGLGYITVIYTPIKTNPAFADKWHTDETFNVSTRDL